MPDRPETETTNDPMTTHKTRAQERAEEIDVSPAALGAEIERLTAELDETRQAGEGYLAALQRERAEFLNYKRRTEGEREAALGLASEFLLAKVLSIADDFDRALEALPGDLRDAAWVDGIVAIDRKVRGLLESEVVAELRKGYRIRDRILRPALVAVSSGGESRPNDAGTSPNGEPGPNPTIH
jgi:molecular chaperone GrpE